jgi:hypothetical protein
MDNEGAELEEDEEFERFLDQKKADAAEKFIMKRKGKEATRPRISLGVGLDGESSLMDLSDDE